MARKPFGIFCPVSKACEVLEPRWTIQILGELWGGATRFNEIRRGIPGISPALLSKRLRELQENGLVERVEDPASGQIDYLRTEKAEELDPIFTALGRWAQRHIDAEVATEDRDADVLMWTLRNKIDISELPPRRNVIRFNYSDATSAWSTYWAIANPGQGVEICHSDPGYDVDLYVETEVRVLVGIYLGRRSLAHEIDAGRLFLSGDVRLARSIHKWLRRSVYADTEGISGVREETLAGR